MNPLYHPKLKKLTKDSVKRFTLKEKVRYAKVVSIYDGDTCDLAFYREDESDDFVRYKCRMSGYYAPEFDEKNGELARDYLAHLCMGGDVAKPAKFCDQNDIMSTKDLQQELDKS